MADPPSNKVNPHGTSVGQKDGGAGATGNFMQQHKTMLIIAGVAVGGLGLLYFLTQSNSGTTAANNAATGTAAGAQDAGTATALNDLQTQFNALQQLISSNTGTVNGNSSGINDLMPPGTILPIPMQPTPGGPQQVNCQLGYYRGNDGNCYPIIQIPNPLPDPGTPPVTTGPVQIMCGPNQQKILGICVNIPMSTTPGGWKAAASGVSGYEANGKSYYYNNGSLQAVGILGSTSDISKAIAPKGWKPAASGVSGYESGGYAAYFNNGSLQSVSLLGSR